MGGIEWSCFIYRAYAGSMNNSEIEKYFSNFLLGRTLKMRLQSSSYCKLNLRGNECDGYSLIRPFHIVKPARNTSLSLVQWLLWWHVKGYLSVEQDGFVWAGLTNHSWCCAVRLAFQIGTKPARFWFKRIQNQVFTWAQLSGTGADRAALSCVFEV